MIRIEIIANQSLEAELTTSLEQAIPDFMYTVIPLVTGRGGDSRKLGDSTWPETNIIIISYADDSVEERVEKVVNFIKKKFPTEGTKLFVLHDK